jgi:hypothetical protein
VTSITETIEKVEAIVPDGSFKSAIKRFRESLFLELPEQQPALWYRASRILDDHFPSDERTWSRWHHDAKHIWMNAQREWEKEQGRSDG